MLGSLLIAAGGGAISALVSTAALVNYLAPLPLLLVGLSLGVGAGAVAAATGAAAVLAIGGTLAAAVFCGAHALPSWLVVRQALSRREDAGGGVTWMPVGSVLASLAVLGAVLAAVVVLFVFGAADVQAAIEREITAMFGSIAPSMPETQIADFAATVAPLFLGMAGSSWLTMLVVNAAVAQTLLARGGRSVRPTPRWSAMALPNWLSWPLVGAAAIGLVADGNLAYLGRNLVIVLAAPYFFLGLAVAHSVVRAKQLSGLVLVAMYVTLVPFFVYGGPVLAAVGMIEQWAGIRRRFGAAGQGSE